MNSLKTKITLLMGVVFAMQLCAQSTPRQKLLDSTIRHGVLENGMEYYIKKNVMPKERASFYLVQKVGAILEDDHQNGLAHVLEHLAFNGSKNFPGKGMQEFLERHGAEFGKSMNAYTAQDETVYNITDVPVNPVVLDSCVWILHDWSGNLSLLPKEIEAERNVIQEEWRAKNNAQFRMEETVSHIRYNNSKYAKRNVIGDMDIVLNFPHKSILDFYEDWYRPNLQAAIIVGDFDVDEMEQRVRTILSTLENPKNAKEREIYTVQDHKGLMYGVATDSEARFLSFEYTMRHNSVSNDKKDREYVVGNMKSALVTQMMNLRFKERVMLPGASFTQARAGYYSFIQDKDIFTMGGLLKEDNVQKGIKDVLVLVEEAKQAGFTQSELEVAKTNLLRGYEYRHNIRENISNDDHAKGMQSSYLYNEPYLSTGEQLLIAEESVSSVTLDDVNGYLSKWVTHNNAFFLLKGPEKEGLVYPTKEEVQQIIEEAVTATYTKKEEQDGNIALLAKEPVKGKIVSKKALDGFENGTEYTLSNGAVVWMVPTDNAKDDVHYSAISKGGMSLLDTEKIPSAKHLVPLVLQSGLGAHDQNQLTKVLAGKALKLEPSLGYYTEGYSGGCDLKDLETLLQLQYLYFTNPRFDQQAFEVYKDKSLSFLENQAKNPRSAFNDTIQQLMTNHSPRRPLNTLELLKSEVDYGDIQEIYKNRYGNVSDFAFVFVGSVTDTLIEPLIEKYIGGIQGSSDREDWVDHGVSPPKKGTKKHFAFPISVPKHTNYVVHYSDTYPYTQGNNIDMEIFKTILDRRLFHKLREEEGGTYGARTNVSYSNRPRSNMALSIFFDCNPEKGAELLQLISDEMDDLLENGATEEEFVQAKEVLIKNRQENLKRNAYWLHMLKEYQLNGINELVEGNYENILRKNTVMMFNRKIGELLGQAEEYEIVMKPQG
ncbi:MAG: insulinase family protein [Algicola sp.]|nr:insulinase family protein [Algicola sp.]